MKENISQICPTIMFFCLLAMFFLNPMEFPLPKVARGHATSLFYPDLKASADLHGLGMARRLGHLFWRYNRHRKI